MNQILIVYWSGTGNTAAMAEMERPASGGWKRAGYSCGGSRSRTAVFLPGSSFWMPVYGG
ncbi:MAG: hypothetical protein ACLVFV_06835 [Clostridium sp.]